MTTSIVQGAPEQADQRTQADATVGLQAAPARRRPIVIIASSVVLIAAAIFIWKGFFAAPRLPDSIVAVSGRIEGDDSAVAPKTTGRILEVRVREGDTVNAGDTIAVLDDAQVRAREDQARATLLEAEAKGKAAQEQIAVLQEQFEQSRLGLGQSKLDTEGRLPTRSPLSIRKRTRASQNPERCRKDRDYKPRRRPISRPR